MSSPVLIADAQGKAMMVSDPLVYLDAGKMGTNIFPCQFNFEG